MHPEKFSTVQGGTVTFEVESTGDEPLQYQWYYNGNPIADASQRSLTLNSVTEAQEGEYHVVVEVDFTIPANEAVGNAIFRSRIID